MGSHVVHQIKIATEDVSNNTMNIDAITRSFLLSTVYPKGNMTYVILIYVSGAQLKHCNLKQKKNTKQE